MAATLRLLCLLCLLRQVDIDIKLRSCKGSCKSYSEYQVDQDSYTGLDKQVSLQPLM